LLLATMAVEVVMVVVVIATAMAGGDGYSQYVDLLIRKGLTTIAPSSRARDSVRNSAHIAR
jgi:hypothetical protein